MGHYKLPVLHVMKCETYICTNWRRKVHSAQQKFPFCHIDHLAWRSFVATWNRIFPIKSFQDQTSMGYFFLTLPCCEDGREYLKQLAASFVPLLFERNSQSTSECLSECWNPTATIIWHAQKIENKKENILPFLGKSSKSEGKYTFFVCPCHRSGVGVEYFSSAPLPQNPPY